MKNIQYKGQNYSQTAFCKQFNINVSTFRSRIHLGMSIDDAIKSEFEKICPICDKKYTTKSLESRYCSNTCLNRGAHRERKGKYKPVKCVSCVVCGKSFETIRNNAKTCSDKCRGSLARINRNKRYKHLREIGEFDENVTLYNVYVKYNGICQHCGKMIDFNSDVQADDYPSIDHVIPLSKGGVHKWDNVQLLCRGCNCKKSNK